MTAARWSVCSGCGTQELGHHVWRGRRSPRCGRCMSAEEGRPTLRLVESMEDARQRRMSERRAELRTLDPDALAERIHRWCPGRRFADEVELFDALAKHEVAQEMTIEMGDGDDE